MATEFEIFDISYGCANLEQAIRAGYETIREAILRPETFRLTTDIEHIRVKRGDRVQHAHDAILVGLGSARIAAIDGSEVRSEERRVGKGWRTQGGRAGGRRKETQK